ARRQLPRLRRVDHHAQAGHRAAPARLGSRGEARGGGLVAEPLEARVVAALASIRNPRLDNDLLSAGMIRDLTVTDAGGVSFTFLLAPEDPATLVRQARSAVQGVEGVRRDDIKITVTNPAGAPRAAHQTPAAPARPPAPIPTEQPDLGRVLAISSGKG